MTHHDPSSRAPNDAAPTFDDIDAAAIKLGMEPDALRARCRRAARRRGDAVVAHLGGGIVAFKFGSSWRVRFPKVWSSDELTVPGDTKGEQP